jgi:universal stress protein family protein
MGSMSQSGRHRTGRHETASHKGGGSPDVPGGLPDAPGGLPDAPGGLPHHLPGQPAERSGPHRVVVVVVDGSPQSGAALRQAASQARQRNALLDIVCIVPDGTDGPASLLARVKLGEFTRRQCPYGMGVPVRLRVERGDPLRVLPEAAADAELLINGLPRPPAAGDKPETPAGADPAPRRKHGLLAPIPAPPA